MCRCIYLFRVTGERTRKRGREKRNKRRSDLFENRRSMFSAISNVCVETPDYPICGNINNMSVEVSKKEHKSLENCFTKDNFVPEGTTLS